MSEFFELGSEIEIRVLNDGESIKVKILKNNEFFVFSLNEYFALGKERKKIFRFWRKATNRPTNSDAWNPFENSDVGKRYYDFMESLCPNLFVQPGPGMCDVTFRRLNTQDPNEMVLKEHDFNELTEGRYKRGIEKGVLKLCLMQDAAASKKVKLENPPTNSQENLRNVLSELFD